jgi:small subunit ribosomal protein S17
MADESQTPEEEPVVDEAPTSEEAAPAEEAEQAAPAEMAAPAEAAEEAAPAAAAAEPGPAQESAEPVTPKQRRQRRRAGKAAKTPSRAQMTPQERQAERDARRVQEREKAREQRSAAPAAEELPALHGERSGQQKTRQGIVVSDRASKTITVRIDVARRHPRYDKVVRTSTTLHVHDEQGDAHIGDTVVVRESRPLSRTKRWRLVEVVERAK